MPLQSKLLGGDARLEAAAVSNPAHIVPGARGIHVGKIQAALILLDRAPIGPGEVAATLYGRSTAEAVLAYKRKRTIINGAYQAQADNIVGKMTVVAMDKELVEIELALPKPAQIKPIHPIGRSRSPQVRAMSGSSMRVGNGNSPQAFGISDFPQILPPNPVGPQQLLGLFSMELRAGSVGVFQVINCLNGTVECWNRDVGIVRDPAQGNAHGGRMTVTANPQTFHVVARGPGDSFVEARAPNSPGRFGTLMSLHVIGLGVARLVSPQGTPVSPKGFARKINIFGEQETAGFEDYATEERWAKYQKNGKDIIRPLTSAPQRPPGIPNNSASDICVRSSPLSQTTLAEMRRIAMPGARITVALANGTDEENNKKGGTNEQLQRLRDAFPEATVVEESITGPFKALVIELP